MIAIITIILMMVWCFTLYRIFNEEMNITKKQIKDLWDQINILLDRQIALIELIKEMREEYYDISRQQIKVKEIHPTDNTELH